MATTKRLERIILTRKRVCSKCGKTMARGDAAIKYTVDMNGPVKYHNIAYWCDDCEKKGEHDGQA